MCFPHHLAILAFPADTDRASCVLTQFCLICLEIALGPEVEGSVPGPPHFQGQSQVQVSPALLTNRLQVEGCDDLLLGFDYFARTAHRAQRNSLLIRLSVYYERT